MSTRPNDIYTEPLDLDPRTLNNLGPLAPLAGIWEGRGIDRHPVHDGVEDDRDPDHRHPSRPGGNGIGHGGARHTPVHRASVPRLVAEPTPNPAALVTGE
jgi:hypothetical protein